MSNFHFSPRPNRANEIHWEEWNPAAFERAKREDKPILLGISAVWCHWCHVMDETTYSDPNIIQLVNERFIPIRVDNDERPDVNRRYNLGGWPTTAFLTAEGELLTGGTYIPPEQMKSYLTQVSDVYKNSRADILDKVAQMNAKRNELLTAPRASSPVLSAEIVDNIQKEILANYDSLYGGFGDEPKFPQTDTLEFLLERYFETRETGLLRVVELTLQKMAEGGMYDQVWGGFFRYSTTRDWSVPHYEKMLEDNAKLLSVYVHAYQVSQKPLYLKVIRSSIAYVDTSLSDQERGGFYGSQDADEHFYALSAEERTKLPAPYVDRMFYTDWNALMISAYLAAANALPEAESHERERLSQIALRSLDRLWNEMYRGDHRFYHYAPQGGKPQVPGLLSDIARATTAFVDAYQATGDNLYLDRAQILAGLALTTLRDEETGTFWSETPDPTPIGLLRVPDRSMSDNAAMADALVRLDWLTRDLQKDNRYQETARQALAFFATDYDRYGFMAADYALAVHHLLHEPVSIHIVGGVEDARTLEMQAAALREFAPEKAIEVLDPIRDGTRISLLGYPHEGAPRAYVCVGDKCLEPVEDAEGVVAGMQEMGPSQGGYALQ